MPQFTIGIEEEYQIIDVESRNLVSHVSKIIEAGIFIYHIHTSIMTVKGKKAE